MRDRIERYLTKRADLESRRLVCGSLTGVRRVVVIPVLAERESIGATLASLAENPAALLGETLVICVVNNRGTASVEEWMRKDNRGTLAYLHGLVRGEAVGGFGDLRVGVVDASSEGCELGAKQGVGTARKLGLDWGLEVLRGEGVSEGLLISLDADTWVDGNYLEAIRGYFDAGERWGAVVDFAHRVDGSDEERAAILSYELFLRYHELGLAYAGSRYAFQTVGSAMVCTSGAYAASGGMKERQAGEDFYFLQELAKTGEVGRIEGTTVRPSSRPSWRVPFGTGKRVDRFLRGEDEEYRVYHSESYAILRGWLGVVAAHVGDDAEVLLGEARAIAEPLGEFLVGQGFESVWPKLRENAADDDSFLRQFHGWFDGFMTLKLIHFLRDHGYPEEDVFVAVGRLLDLVGEDGMDLVGMEGDLERQRALIGRMRGLPGTLGRE